jgi:hypothetical protein
MHRKTVDKSKRTSRYVYCIKCGGPGYLSDSVRGGGPWYCRKCYAIKQGVLLSNPHQEEEAPPGASPGVEGKANGR